MPDIDLDKMQTVFNILRMYEVTSLSLESLWPNIAEKEDLNLIRSEMKYLVDNYYLI